MVRARKAALKKYSLGAWTPRSLMITKIETFHRRSSRH